MTCFLSVRRKIFWTAVLSSVASLAVAAVVMLVYQCHTYQAEELKKLQIRAHLVAHASIAPLIQGNHVLVQENLALLGRDGHIQQAALYLENGQQVASYTAAGVKPTLAMRIDPTQLADLGELKNIVSTDNSQLQILQAVERQGKKLGFMKVQAQYQHQALVDLKHYLSALGLIVAFSAAFAAWMAYRLQRRMVDPLMGRAAEDFKLMMKEFSHQTQVLQESDQRKDEFIAMLAHELRNPLAPLANALSILQRNPPDDQTRRLYQMMQRQMNHLVRLLDDLLEVSRLTGGRLRLQFKSLDLVEAVRTAIESIRPALQEQQHQLVFEPSPEVLCEVRGDMARLVQVLVILLNNAIKYTQKGGSIEVALHQKGHVIELQVIDNGIGIDRLLQKRVFDLFVQIDKFPQSGRGGLGVGLWLARQLVEMHGGTLSLVSSRPGRGSTFCVQLPCLPQDQKKPLEAQDSQKTSVSASA
jgi:two-component system, sensor histidine kinase